MLTVGIKNEAWLYSYLFTMINYCEAMLNYRLCYVELN